MDLTQFGGRPQNLAGADPNNPQNITWNFGVKPKTEPVRAMIQAKPTFSQRFPNLVGAWDGKSTINHWDAVTKVFGQLGKNPEELIQQQPRGTCGGRAGSFTGDMVQCILIAAGKRAHFYRTSHAAVYYVARKKYDMIGGDWRDEDSDGVASGSVPNALHLMGYVQREEDQDNNWYGQGSDDLACQLGAGKHPDLAAKIEQWGKDNPITEWTPVHSAQELADGIAAGGVGIGSDNQGFTTTRDKDGFCRPQGTWSHYQVRCSVGVWNGRKGFGYNQSWGKNMPSGTLLAGHPGNCFGVDFDTQDRIIRSGDWAVIFGFPLWELESGNVSIPWMYT